MAKDEKIWIPDNYYNGFLRGCLANELLEDTPSKTALENAGCEISALCYLVLPDGSQHNPRLMKPNEFPTSIRKLFEALPLEHYSEDGPIEESSDPVVKDAQELNDMLSNATSQTCDQCNQPKPLQAFKRFPGRASRYRTTCIECQTNMKEPIPKFKEDTSPVPTPISQVEESITDAEVIETKPMAVVSLDYLKRMAKDAFERGREYERSNIETIEPSLEELLGIGA